MKIFKLIGKLFCKVGLHKEVEVVDFWMTELQDENMPFDLGPCHTLKCIRCGSYHPPLMTFEEYKRHGGKQKVNNDISNYIRI